MHSSHEHAFHAFIVMSENKMSHIYRGFWVVVVVVVVCVAVLLVFLFVCFLNGLTGHLQQISAQMDSEAGNHPE